MSNRVLIVDDEENIRQMIRLTLDAAGYDVSEAEDGVEAFAILGGDPDWNVIMLDQRMPIMEGTDVLRRIKVLAPHARVVMKLGATDFLRKPMTPEIVRNSVSAALQKTREETFDVQALSSDTDAHRSVTMNGFTILRKSNSTGSLKTQSPECGFIVRKPDGSEQPVSVVISETAIKEAERLMRSEPDDAFWILQAETFLSDFIWNDGNVPADGKLILKGLDRDLLRTGTEQAEET